MSMKYRRGLRQYFLNICTTYGFRLAFDVFCISLEVHVLQCVASMQPIVSRWDCDLEDLNDRVFLLNSMVFVASLSCSTRVINVGLGGVVSILCFL